MRRSELNRSVTRPAFSRRAAASVALLFGAVAIGGLAATIKSLQVSQQRSTQQIPTYTRDIAPIIYKNCSGCHRPDGMAPMSLLTYEETDASAAEIHDHVAKGFMPPWHADGPRGVFANDRRLSDADKNAIIRWIENGTPRGNAADMPPAPKFESGWTIGKPDTVITMPAPYEVPAQGEIPYQYIRIPTNFTEDRWVQAIEIMPGAREVVHHVLVYSRVPVAPGAAGAPGTGAAGTSRAAAAGRGGAQLTPEQRANAASQPPSGFGTLIATTAPGTNAQVFPAGTALRIPAGAVLTFQMHYTAHGKAMKDQSSLGLVFSKQPPAQEMHAGYFINARLVIPAGASDHRVDAQVNFATGTRIYGIMPHTHLRGKRWEYKLVTADGQSRTILSVPNYDFNWQTYYMFREPLVVPAGSRIESSAWYDNSAANKSNPDPTKEVHWGEQTWEEMQYTGLLFTRDSLPRPGG
jgi:mono/diheme cytochrome c family protein